MKLRHAAPLACALALTCGGSALAQEAAETAQVLSGVSGQGRASRSLGSAISGSFNRAAEAIRSTRGGTPRPRSGTARVAAPGGALPRGGNDLKDTDAASYRTGGSATISVSGGFRASAGTSCVKNCESEASGAPAAH